MQILFVAPFLLAAALAFTLLAAVPQWRRWAIPIPTGILAAAPSLFAGMGAVLLINHLLGYDAGPQPKIILVCLSIGIPAGILGGAAAGIIAHLLTGILPRLILRSAVLVAAWCSYFVLLIVLDIAAASHWSLTNSLASWLVEASLAFIGAWLVARKPDPFRSSSFRLPMGSRFPDRLAGAPPGADPLDEQREAPKKVSALPSSPADQL
jgi:hypothetical protein